MKNKLILWGFSFLVGFLIVYAYHRFSGWYAAAVIFDMLVFGTLLRFILEGILLACDNQRRHE